jgi:hypothetical protein
MIDGSNKSVFQILSYWLNQVGGGLSPEPELRGKKSLSRNKSEIDIN